jgi:hypothetical protein
MDPTAVFLAMVTPVAAVAVVLVRADASWA